MSKTVTGGRAKVFVDGVLVGIFDSCTTSKNFGIETIHTLGKYGPQENVYTSVEAVNVSCTGFRVVGSGVHTLPKVPKVQDLLNFNPFTITVVDRQTGKTIRTIQDCTPSNDNDNFNAKATSKVSVNYIGILAFDESGDQGEGGSTTFP